MRLSLAEVASITGGTVVGDPDIVVTSVAIDSRSVEPGGLFLALKGEHADGHDFVADAAARGAHAALVARAVDGACVQVASVEDALTALGQDARDRIGGSVVAVTGSSGKTGTKDLIAAALGGTLSVSATRASLNNELGVPLTLLAAPDGVEAVVVEVGARGVGHLADLMPMVRPSVGVVINVGTAHVGEFGSVERIAQAKGELVEALSADGVAILNGDDALVSAMATRTVARALRFGMSSECDVRATDVRLDDRGCPGFTAHVGGREVRVQLAMVGEHLVSNALAALAVADALQVDLDAAAAGIATCEPAPGRMQPIAAGDRTIIHDAYNANPASVAAALKTLATLGRTRPTWAVLGYMAELGAHEVEAHDAIGRLAVRLGISGLVTVGRDARAIHEAARLEGMFGGESHLVETVEEAIELLQRVLEPDAVVLVKASRAARLERIVEALT